MIVQWLKISLVVNLDVILLEGAQMAATIYLILEGNHGNDFKKGWELGGYS